MNDVLADEYEPWNTIEDRFDLAEAILGLRRSLKPGECDLQTAFHYAQDILTAFRNPKICQFVRNCVEPKDSEDFLWHLERVAHAALADNRYCNATPIIPDWLEGVLRKEVRSLGKEMEPTDPQYDGPYGRII